MFFALEGNQIVFLVFYFRRKSRPSCTFACDHSITGTSDEPSAYTSTLSRTTTRTLSRTRPPTCSISCSSSSTCRVMSDSSVHLSFSLHLRRNLPHLCRTHVVSGRQQHVLNTWSVSDHAHHDCNGHNDLD